MINVDEYDTYLSNLDINISNNYTSNSSYIQIPSKRIKNNDLTKRTTEIIENELNELDFGDDDFYSISKNFLIFLKYILDKMSFTIFFSKFTKN